MVNFTGSSQFLPQSQGRVFNMATSEKTKGPPRLLMRILVLLSCCSLAFIVIRSLRHKGGGSVVKGVEKIEDAILDFKPIESLEEAIYGKQQTHPNDLPKDWNAFRPNVKQAQIGKEKAVFVMLVRHVSITLLYCSEINASRNRELQDALSTMKQIEDRFNRAYHYPWVFLNDEPFTQDFIDYTSALASSKTEYDIIPKEHWSFPDHLEMEKFEETAQKMAEHGVIYGESLPYRHMCRFNSGFFWQQKVMEKYDW